MCIYQHWGQEAGGIYRRETGGNWVGWPFLEKVLTKAQKLAKQSIGPLEAEQRQLQEQLNTLHSEIQGLLGVAKAGGESQEAATELKRLETAKVELAARITQTEATVAHRRRAVYDVDAIQGVFKRFALFINRVPVETKVQIIRLMVEQVIVSNNRIEVRLHELPVGVLHKALDKRVVFRGDGFAKRRGAETTTNKNCHRSSVAEFVENWRGRRDLNPRSLP